MWIQLASEGGTDPLFRRDGRELFYRNGDKMMAVQVSTSSEFKAGPPVVLRVGHYSHGLSSSCGPLASTPPTTTSVPTASDSS
jgi:hypothetical protein